MKRYLAVLPVLLLLAPLAAHATLLGSLAISGYAYNGSEQTNEANVISNALSAYGANGGVTGGSSYRNSYYQFRATGGYYFTLDGANLGSNITIVHRKDWIGVATNICASWGGGYLDGQVVNDSNCNYYATWGRYDRTLGLNSPPPPSAPGWISGSCPSPGTSAAISWGSGSGSGITYALRADMDPSSWNGSCNPSSGSGDYCQDNLTSTSRSVSTSPGHSYQIWVHAVNSSGWSNATLSNFTCAFSPCSYSGTVQWSNCSTYYNGTVQNGSSVTLQNSASGYSGSATFSCSNGNWVGVSSSCNAVVNGSCSSSHYNCSAGNSVNQSSNSSTWTWQCRSPNNGSTASCSETKAVDGSCASTHYTCNAGSSTNNQSNATTWTWNCNGTANGNNVSCSEPKPVNGSCSSSHYDCNAGSSTNNQSNNSTLWYAGSNGLKSINKTTGSTMFNSPALSDAVSIAFDPSTNTLWYASPGGLKSINKTTGSTMFNSPALSDAVSIAFDPSTGTLWYASPSVIKSINKTTGAATKTFTLSLFGSANVKSIAFDPSTGTLWYASPSGLKSLDKTNGTTIKAFSNSDAKSITFDASTGTLWYAGSNGLKSINKTTGSTMFNSPALSDAVSIAFDPSTNTLWYASPGGLKSINKTTGSTMFNSPALSDAVSIAFDASQTWTWSCQGTNGGSTASCSESTPPPTPTYTISASAGSGGSISPSGSVSVTQGNNQSFSISPSGGYTIASVTVDGGNVGNVSSYTFSNVQGGHTISASFTPSNAAPSAPVISGPTSGNANTSYTFSVNSTDPQGNQIRYGIDWTEPADGVADVWLPAGVNYVNSGTSQSTTHSWSSSGTHTFRALAQDAPGLNSSWSSYSFTVSSCTPTYFCSGNDLYYRNASCVESLSQTCGYGCAGSACIPPPSIGFTPFSASNVTYGPFTATGHLEVKPSLLWSGNTTSVYWNVSNAQSCSVTGSNGDSWSGSFSGSGGKTSSPITSQTTYTLACTGFPGATPISVIETVTVNIIPVFEEK